jgi:hypothetical protein
LHDSAWIRRTRPSGQPPDKAIRQSHHCNEARKFQLLTGQRKESVSKRSVKEFSITVGSHYYLQDQAETCCSCGPERFTCWTIPIAPPHDGGGFESRISLVLFRLTDKVSLVSVFRLSCDGRSELLCHIITRLAPAIGKHSCPNSDKEDFATSCACTCFCKQT